MPNCCKYSTSAAISFGPEEEAAEAEEEAAEAEAEEEEAESIGLETEEEEEENDESRANGVDEIRGHETTTVAVNPGGVGKDKP